MTNALSVSHSIVSTKPLHDNKFYPIINNVDADDTHEFITKFFFKVLSQFEALLTGAVIKKSTLKTAGCKGYRSDIIVLTTKDAVACWTTVNYCGRPKW
jgi:hypothetical protein